MQEENNDVLILGSLYTDLSILNTFLGHQAGLLASGAKNTFIGCKSGSANTTGESNVYIGFKAGATATATQSNKLIIANSEGNNLITGDFLTPSVQINGRLITLGIIRQVTNIVADLTAGDHHIIIADATAGNIVITLPAVATSTGREYKIKRSESDASGNTVTIEGAGAETIDGAANLALLKGIYATLICDGTEWHTI